MLLHPDLRALRADDSPQRLAQAMLLAGLTQWRERSLMQALLAELPVFAGGGALAECPALAGLFSPSSDTASGLAGSLAAALAALLERAPLGHVPLRHFTDGVTSTLLLARSGPATLSLVAIDGDGLRDRPAPVTVDFPPSESWERVLAGNARGETIRCTGAGERRAELDRRAVQLAPGDTLARDAACEALQILVVDGCLVLLRLQRRRAGAGPTREYALADGALVHQAAGNPRESRIELMMAVLGRMGRTDAAPQLAAIAREPGSAPLRWQALRECLALDPQEGFAALSQVAVDPADPLAPAAGALLAQLLERYPALAMVPCPA